MFLHRWEQVIAPEDGVTVVEWPERAGDWLPDRYLLVSILHAGPDAREVIITGDPPERAVCLDLPES